MRQSLYKLLILFIALGLAAVACTTTTTTQPEQPAPTTPVEEPVVEEPEVEEPVVEEPVVEEEAPTEVPPTEEPPMEEPEAAEDDQTLVIAGGVDVESMNIQAATASPSFSVLQHFYETLFEMTPEGELVPHLAESMEAGEEENTFVITLKEGIQFSDGTPFNAEAVKINLDRVLDPENAAPFRFLIDRIQEVTVIDDYTVQLSLTSSFAPLVNHLSHSSLGIMSPSAIEQGNDFLASNAIGTGPYVLADWQRDEAVTMTRNPNYWGDAPAIETVVFRVIPEDGARLIEVEAGTVDVAVRVPPAEAARLEANPDINLTTVPGLRTIYIFFNTTQEPFDDVRVRQAVNYAVDVEGIVNSLFEGAARVSDAPVAPAVFGYSAQTPYARDLDRARELLDEAGVEEGTTVVLYHPTGRYIQDALVADAVRAQLAEVGLNVELQTLEWTQYVPYVRREAPENDVQFAMLGWGTVTMDADYGLFALFHSSEIPPGFNGAFYNNPDVDALLDEARINLNPDERQALYDQAISIIWEDAPWLFLYSEVQLTAVRSNVDGFIVHPDESLIATFATKQ
jgi:ABC-type transport system substrate-binding protein